MGRGARLNYSFDSQVTYGQVRGVPNLEEGGGT